MKKQKCYEIFSQVGLKLVGLEINKETIDEYQLEGVCITS